MNIADIMNENDIQTDWVFTHGRLHNQEGIVFFEVGTQTEEINGEEQQFQTIDPKCILIDGARFNYSETMDHELELNSKDNAVIFNRIDGLEVKIPTTDFKDMPFRINEFSKKTTGFKPPADHIEVE